MLKDIAEKIFVEKIPIVFIRKIYRIFVIAKKNPMENLANKMMKKTIIK